MKTVVLFGLLAVAGSAHALPITLHGAGVDSCGEWLEASKTNNITVISIQRSWIQGYLDGRNIGSLDTVHKEADLPDIYATSAWIDNYCHANPLSKLAEAASDLYRGLELHAPEKSP